MGPLSRFSPCTASVHCGWLRVHLVRPRGAVRALFIAESSPNALDKQTYASHWSLRTRARRRHIMASYAKEEDDNQTLCSSLLRMKQAAPWPATDSDRRGSDSELHQNISNTLVVNNDLRNNGEFAAEGSGAVSTPFTVHHYTTTRATLRRPLCAGRGRSSTAFGPVSW